MFDGRPQNVELLGVFEGGILADGAEHDHAMHACGDHGVEMFRRRLQIQSLVRLELRGQRRKNTAPIGFHE